MAVLSDVALPDRRYARAVVATILVLVGIRLVFAALIPLSFEEGIFWLWSKYPAWGYYDQPPIGPFLIRLGTALFGDNEFGVRVCDVLLALPASWAVWRAGAILFKDEHLGATAALYFNLTLVIAAGSIIATADSALVVSIALLLLALAKLQESGRAYWWLVIGLAFGVGMLSKYTTVFFAVSILIWLLLVPELRKWLRTAWPYLAGLIALALFSPTLWWNAEHHWISFYRQSKRLVVEEWSLRYLGEFLLSQIGMATPPIFILGCMGLSRLMQGQGGGRAARVLINAMVWPLVVLFVWQTFHSRVEGNWPEPIFVAFVIAAAVAAERIKWDGAWNGIWAWLASWSRRLAVPVGLIIAGVIYAQAAFGIVPLGIADPTARALGVGWRDLAARIDAERVRLGAPIILNYNHALVGWLSFYLPSRVPVVQMSIRARYLNIPDPDPALFRGNMMFVCIAECPYEIADLHRRFRTVEPVTRLVRSRHGVPIDTYAIYRLADPIAPILDPPW